MLIRGLMLKAIAGESNSGGFVPIQGCQTIIAENTVQARRRIAEFFQPFREGCGVARQFGDIR